MRVSLNDIIIKLQSIIRVRPCFVNGVGGTEKIESDYFVKKKVW